MNAGESDVKRDSRWRTPLFWLLSTASLPPAGLLAKSVAGSVDDPGSGAIAGAIAGTVIGAAQWLVLRNRVANAGWWIPATGAGLAAGLATGTAAVDARTGGADLAISGAIAGLTIGALQYLVLRGTTARAPAWIPAMAASWSIGWLITWAIGVDVESGWSNFGAAGAVVFGALTGLVLMQLLPQATPSTPAAS
jgi:hypothetical protein